MMVCNRCKKDIKVKITSETKNVPIQFPGCDSTLEYKLSMRVSSGIDLCGTCLRSARVMAVMQLFNDVAGYSPVAALKELVNQIEINDFQDSNGHSAKMLAALNDAKKVLDIFSEFDYPKTTLELATRLDPEFTRTQTGHFVCRCPCHSDTSASLLIDEKVPLSDGLRLSCHAGCSYASVLRALRRRGLIP